MTRFSLLVLMLLAVAGCSGARPGAEATTTTPATDARLRVMGRHLLDGETVRFAASGVTFSMRFRGTALAVRLETTPPDSAGHDWFTVVVDDGAPRRFRTQPGQSRYVLASGLAPGVHTAVLSKATEGQNGHNRLVSVETDELLAADPLPGRAIEFIGDSITAGFGLDPEPVACNTGMWYDASHAWLAYGPRLARRLGAQWMLSSVSGIGIVRNWNTPGPVMPAVYDGVFTDYDPDGPTWDAGLYRPSLVVIALGTNDFSKGETDRPALDGQAFVRDYSRFAARLRARYPTARFLLVNSPMIGPTERDLLEGYLRAVVANRAAVGDTAFETFTFSQRYTNGCGSHPGLGDQAHMADEMETAVRSLMDW